MKKNLSYKIAYVIFYSGYICPEDIEKLGKAKNKKEFKILVKRLYKLYKNER